MSQPVRIENDALQIEVWPTIGGKIASFIDKADQHELLFNYPAELPPGPQYDIPYSSSWYGGWDECFPAIARGPYSGHPYDGIVVPDHGELWGLPTMSVPTKLGITTVWNGLRFGYRLTRKLYLEDASLIAEYTLVNLAPFEFRFVWAAHALLSLTSPARFDFKKGSLFELLHDQAGQQIRQTFEWPRADDLDFSSPSELPLKKGWKLYSTNPIDAPVTITYPARSRTLTLSYDSDESVAAFWGIWINTGGWNGHRHFAIEPTTGTSDRLDESIKNASAARVGPMGRVSWNVRFTVA